MKRRSSFALAALALLLLLTGAAGAVRPEQTGNLNGHEYVNGRRWAEPIRSHLYENRWGGVTRVEYVGGSAAHVVVEDYDGAFALLSSRTVAAELPVWGGFFAGENYFFLVFGQNNREEDDSREVIRVVRYDKDWNRMDSASLYGANTTVPFDAGSLRFAEYGGWLYIRTCHEMYALDGVNHQANVMIALRQSDMKITDSYTGIMNEYCGYVSHSFNQFVLVDGQRNIVTLDHGDAGPRSIVLMRYYAKAGQESFRSNTPVPLGGGYYTYAWCDYVDVQKLPDAAQYNDTGASLGGFAETADGYAVAYSFDGTASMYGRDPRDVYLAFVGKDLAVKTTRLTTGMNASAPYLVPTGLDGGYIMWTENRRASSSEPGVLYYAAYDARGNVGETKTARAAVSDCQPVYCGGRVVWYVTDGSAPTFYVLDGSGVAACAAGVPTAVSSVEPVKVDGREVSFCTYQIKVDGVNEANFVKLRDLACVLSGTAAQFEVDYDDGTGRVLITTGRPYTAVGGEMKAVPAHTQKTYAPSQNAYSLNGRDYAPTAYTIDDNNYIKLRDLGEALGFNVGWSEERGVFIETDKPYTDAD